MVKGISRILNILALLFLLALMFFAVPSLFDPQFQVINHSPEVVQVTAQWRNKERNLGRIEPGSTHEFSIDDEAAITFKIGYENGREIISEPLYFTRGLKVIAYISIQGVKVHYEHETEMP